MNRRHVIATVVAASTAAGLLTAGAGGTPARSVRANPSRGCPSRRHSLEGRQASSRAEGSGRWPAGGSCPWVPGGG